MPEDTTRITYDENGGKVTRIPKGTPKQEMAKAKEKAKAETATDEVETKPQAKGYRTRKMGSVK